MSDIAASHIIRLTGVLIENGKLLVLEQAIGDREWYLPGGKLECGETIKQGIVREIREETGLNVKFEGFICVVPLIYRETACFQGLSASCRALRGGEIG